MAAISDDVTIITEGQTDILRLDLELMELKCAGPVYGEFALLI